MFENVIFLLLSGDAWINKTFLFSHFHIIFRFESIIRFKKQLYATKYNESDRIRSNSYSNYTVKTASTTISTLYVLVIWHESNWKKTLTYVYNCWNRAHNYASSNNLTFHYLLYCEIRNTVNVFSREKKNVIWLKSWSGDGRTNRIGSAGPDVS